MKNTTTALVAALAALSFSVSSVAVAQDTTRPGVEKRDGAFVDGDAARTQRAPHPGQGSAQTVGPETTAAPEVAERDGSFVDGSSAHKTRAPGAMDDIPSTGTVATPPTMADTKKRDGAFVDGEAARETRAPTPLK